MSSCQGSICVCGQGNATQFQYHTEACQQHQIRLIRQRDSILQRQVGGDHYRKLGDYQPWKVLHATMTPDEFRGYMLGTARVYLTRDKANRREDVEKALHTLQGWMELTEGEQS